MSDELKAAAERIRRVLRGDSTVDVYGEPSIFESVLSGITEDRHTLSQAYLSEHPPDDDEPWTEDWLWSVGFGEWEGSYVWGSFGIESADGVVEICEIGGCGYCRNPGEATEAYYPLPITCKTRGDVRRLLSTIRPREECHSQE